MMSIEERTDGLKILSMVGLVSRVQLLASRTELSFSTFLAVCDRLRYYMYHNTQFHCAAPLEVLLDIPFFHTSSL